MKKFAVLLLALCLMCGVLAGCASDKGNIDDTDGVVTDSPRDDDDNGGIIDDMTDGDKDGHNDKDGDKNGTTGGQNDKGGDQNGTSGGQNGNSSGNSGDTVPTSIPGQSPAVATQPVTP